MSVRVCADEMAASGYHASEKSCGLGNEHPSQVTSATCEATVPETNGFGNAPRKISSSGADRHSGVRAAILRCVGVTSPIGPVGRTRAIGLRIPGVSSLLAPLGRTSMVHRTPDRRSAR